MLRRAGIWRGGEFFGPGKRILSELTPESSKNDDRGFQELLREAMDNLDF